nr:unnamed protein product [Callosobruchus analis]
MSENGRNAGIVPIPKTNRPKNMSDLSPINLLPILSKVLERIILKIQVSDYVEACGINPRN